MKTKIIIGFLLVMLLVSIVSAATVTINSDKTISVNGKKTFIIGMFNICGAYYPPVNCQNNINANSNAVRSNTAGDIVFQNSIKNSLEANNIYYYREIGWNYDSVIANSPHFIGYNQLDEVTVGTHGWETDAQMLSYLESSYKSKHAQDPSHPVLLNHWTKMTKWLPYTDIMIWDTYTVTNYQWAGGQPWTREDAIYAWEISSWSNFFQGTELNKINKPVWTYIQAYGIESQPLLVMTPTVARANTYAAITLDVKGILYFGYMMGGDWTTSTSNINGLYANPTLAKYYNSLMGELKGFNDILVLPTIDYHWTHHPGSKVSFSKNYVKNVYWEDTTNFNYILKQSGSTYYLIVVNKDRRAITTDISIPSLSGSYTAKTLGTVEAGSVPNRIIPVNAGKFTDSFDGLGVHIYQITPGTVMPTPTITTTVKPTPTVTVPQPGIDPFSDLMNYIMSILAGLFRA